MSSSKITVSYFLQSQLETICLFNVLIQITKGQNTEWFLVSHVLIKVC